MKLTKLALALLLSLVTLPAIAGRDDDDDRDGVEQRHVAHKDRYHDEGKHLGQKKYKHKNKKRKHHDDDFVESPRLPAPPRAPLPDLPKPRLPDLPKPHLPDLPKPKLPDLPRPPLPPLPGRN